MVSFDTKTKTIICSATFIGKGLIDKTITFTISGVVSNAEFLLNQITDSIINSAIPSTGGPKDQQNTLAVHKPAPGFLTSIGVGITYKFTK